MAQVKLTNKLDVAEELVLALHLHVTVILKSVRLACILCLLFERFEVFLVHVEDLLIHRATICKQLLPKVAMGEVCWARELSLRLEVNLDDRGAQSAVELGVNVLSLSLAEDRFHDDFENLIVNLEVFRQLRIEPLFMKKLPIANQHLAQIADHPIKIIWSDQVQFEAHFLSIVLFLFGFLLLGPSFLSCIAIPAVSWSAHI